MPVRFSELEDARIGVWGAGREIASLARQLARRLPGARIVAAVFDAPPGARELAALDAPGAVIGDAEHAQALLGSCDVVVRSPGVSIHRPELAGLIAGGTPVTTATGLWLAERGGGGVVGITGTKGKSTTAALTAHLLRAAGVPVSLAGNIGVPALDLLEGGQQQTVVVELSSYQIADLRTGPEVALLTNLYREHVDWHGSEEVYRAEKLRLFALPGVRVCILGAGQAPAGIVPPGAQLMRFGGPGGWELREGVLAHDGTGVLALNDVPLRGQHNALNLCAALTVLDALGVSPPLLPGALEGFSALPHRLTTVLERDGVLWVDDSISTTPESTRAALASFPGREIVLIAGGQDRGQDFAELARELAAGDVTLIAVPSTGPRLLTQARRAGLRAARSVQAADMREAVSLARARAGAGGVVLLSPAAPSYDHYRDFEERGELFATLAGAVQEPGEA